LRNCIKDLFIHRGCNSNAVNYSKIPFKLYFLIIFVFVLVTLAFLGIAAITGAFEGSVVEKVFFVATFVAPTIVALLSVVSCIIVVSMDKSSNYSENSRFDDLKRQFWLIFFIQLIVATVILIQIIAFARYFGGDQSHDSMTLLDIIKCYSAALILIFAIDFKASGQNLIESGKRWVESTRATTRV
jgi:hypothetical protein